MKKNTCILAIIFLILPAFFQGTQAQERSRDDREKEKEMQDAIDAQKKAMIEQKKAQEEMQKALETSREEVQKAMQNFREQMNENPEQFDRIYRFYDNRDRSGGRTDEPFPLVVFGRNLGSDSERTTWEFSKYVRESTFSRDYTFDVEPTVRNVMMSVNGDCKSGEIRIKIIMPNGKTYSDILIDEFGSLNWRKSFIISESENLDKEGPWKFEINSSKASGFFKISLQTY